MEGNQELDYGPRPPIPVPVALEALDSVHEEPATAEENSSNEQSGHRNPTSFSQAIRGREDSISLVVTAGESPSRVVTRDRDASDHAALLGQTNRPAQLGQTDRAASGPRSAASAPARSNDLIHERTSPLSQKSRPVSLFNQETEKISFDSGSGSPGSLAASASTRSNVMVDLMSKRPSPLSQRKRPVSLFSEESGRQELLLSSLDSFVPVATADGELASRGRSRGSSGVNSEMLELLGLDKNIDIPVSSLHTASEPLTRHNEGTSNQEQPGLSMFNLMKETPFEDRAEAYLHRTLDESGKRKCWVLILSLEKSFYICDLHV
jgi:hypothetical protein